MRTSGRWMVVHLADDPNKSNKDSNACKCKRVIGAQVRTTALKLLGLSGPKNLSEEFDPGSE